MLQPHLRNNLAAINKLQGDQMIFFTVKNRRLGSWYGGYPVRMTGEPPFDKLCAY